MICSGCGAGNREDAKFCNECGAPLSAVCPSCGVPVRPGQRFCDECGTALAASAVPRLGTAGEHGGGSAIPAEPELRLVSVLFVDLVGFTALSEGRDAADVRDLLGRYFDLAKIVVARYGGTIEKFIGDAVMAVWGAAAAREDDAERAVRAALEIVDAVAEFGAELGAPDLRARAGVVTGQAAALESSDEGIVVGDRVNTAARVQSAAQAGSVLVDDVTKDVASAAILFEDAGEHTVKGKLEPLRLWRAVRVVAGAGGREREQLLEAPFVGRDSELRLVKELLHATVERSGARLVAVSGDAGIGKSRLRRELSNYIDGLRQLFLWHTGRCLAHGEGVAYWALAEMVRNRLGIAEDAPEDEAAARLEEGLREWIVDPEERAFVHPRIGALIGVTAPGLDRTELFAGWRLFFERLAGQHPVILVFEDMQWADEGLLAFIDQILDWSRTVPILILTLARPELADRHDGWPAGRRGVTAIDLEPLTDQAVVELLDGMVSGLPPGMREQIVDRARGNPLYVIETLRSLVDQGVLTQDRPDRLLAGESAANVDLNVPASLNALLAARLDALDPAERELVKAVSVFGGSFPVPAVASLADVPVQRAEALLASLVRKQVLVVLSDPLSPNRGQYAFAQGLLRTVAHETLSRRTRKQLHLAAAAHLRSSFANDGEDVAEVIATHVVDAYEAAGPQDDDREALRRQAVDALTRSAERAETVGAPHVAAAALTRAAELAGDDERPALLLRAGRLALTSGRHEQAIALADRARELLEASGREREAAVTQEVAADALIRLGRMGDARARLQTAIDTVTQLAGGAQDPDLPGLQLRLGRSLTQAGEYERADRLLDEALVAAQAFGLVGVLASALERRATLYDQYLGRPIEAEALYRQALDLSESHGLADIRARASANFAEYARVWNRPGARELLEQSLVLARSRGDLFAEAHNVHNMGDFYLSQGRWERAQALAEEVLAREAEGDGIAEMLEHVLLGLRVLRGDAAAAAEALAGMGAWEHTEARWFGFLYRADVVRVAATGGDPQRTLALGRRLLEDTRAAFGESVDTPSLVAWPQVLEAALVLGDLDAAAEVIEFLARHRPGLMPPFARAHLLRGQGLVAAADGDLEAAERSLRAAIELFDQIEFAYWRAVAEVDLAGVLIRQGRGGDATPPLERATALLQELAAEPVLARARELADALVPSAGQRAS